MALSIAPDYAPDDVATEPEPPGPFDNGYKGGFGEVAFPDGLDRDPDLPDLRDTL